MANSYPVYKKARYGTLVVLFGSETKGEVVVGDENFKIGDVENDWFSANNHNAWVDVVETEIAALKQAA